MRILTITFTILLCAALAPSANARTYPETIPLPNGWQPEGIATGAHKSSTPARARPARSSRAT